MRIIKFSLIFLCLFIYLLIGALVRVVLAFTKPYTATKALNQMTYYLMHIFTAIGGFKITTLGNNSILKKSGLFVICPHIGYLDAIILGTLLPGSFTTKTDVKKIPLLGQVVSIGDSIFIDRKKKNHIKEYISEMTDRLQHKINIFNFPEGHASNGEKILPFFPSFFNAPIQAKSPIVPMTIDYHKVDGDAKYNREKIYCYDGRVSTIRHLWNLMKLKRIDVTVTIHETIQAKGHQANSKGRNFISNLCLTRLSTYTKLPIEETHPLQNPTASKTNKKI